MDPAEAYSFLKDIAGLHQNHIELVMVVDTCHSSIWESSEVENRLHYVLNPEGLGRKMGRGNESGGLVKLNGDPAPMLAASGQYI